MVVPKTTSLQYLCNISRKTKDEVAFLPADKHQRFLQSDTIILDVATHKPKLPKIKSLLFLCNILRKVADEVDFLHADKHESLLQIDTMTLMGMVKHSQSS